MFCQKCGNQLEGNEKFCMKCGTNTNVEVVPSANAQQSPLPQQTIPSQNNPAPNQNSGSNNAGNKTLIFIIIGVLLVGAIVWLGVENYKANNKTTSEKALDLLDSILD